MGISKRSAEVFVIKEVFPHGVRGRFLLNSRFEILEADEEFVKRSFFYLFAIKEKVRLNHFLEKSRLKDFSMLTSVQLSTSRKIPDWISICAKREVLNNDEEGYRIILLDEADSFATLSFDKFDVLYHSLMDMYESELMKIGLTLRDDIAQELYALRMSMQKFIISYGYESEIATIKKQLNDTICKVSDLSNDLLPNVLAHMGFLPAMEELVFSLKRRGCQLLSKIDRRMNDKTTAFQFCCYRVVQALLQSWEQNKMPYVTSLLIAVKGHKVTINLSKATNSSSTSHYYSKDLLQNVRNRIALYEGSLEIERVLNNDQVRITMYN